MAELRLEWIPTASWEDGTRWEARIVGDVRTLGRIMKTNDGFEAWAYYGPGNREVLFPTMRMAALWLRNRSELTIK